MYAKISLNPWMVVTNEVPSQKKFLSSIILLTRIVAFLDWTLKNTFFTLGWSWWNSEKWSDTHILVFNDIRRIFLSQHFAWKLLVLIEETKSVSCGEVQREVSYDNICCFPWAKNLWNITLFRVPVQNPVNKKKNRIPGSKNRAKNAILLMSSFVRVFVCQTVPTTNSWNTQATPTRWWPAKICHVYDEFTIERWRNSVTILWLYFSK